MSTPNDPNATGPQPKNTPDLGAASDRTQDLDDLVAYLDGELDPVKAEAIKTKLTLDPKLRAEADTLKKAWDVLDILPKPVPSSAFVTKTVTQAIPALPGGTISSTIAVPSTTPSSGQMPATTTMMTMPAAKPGWSFWLAAVLIVGAASVSGYYLRVLLDPPRTERDQDAQIFQNLTLYKNMRLYRHIDDVEYLKNLDSPELFGEDD